MKFLPIRFLLGIGLLSFTLGASAQAPTVTVLAGSSGFFDSTFAYAQFKNPYHILFNKKKNEYYVADRGNYRIRVIKNNLVSTLAGNGILGTNNGVGAAARLTGPAAFALNKSGDTLYFADVAGNRDGRIRFVVLSGPDSTKVGTIAGSSGGNPGPGNNAVGLEARFGGSIISIALIGRNIYFSDFGPGSNRLRRVSIDGTNAVTSLDSTGGFSYNLNKGFVFGEVEGICKGRSDTTIYLSSRTSNKISKVNLETGVINTLAGTGVVGSNNATLLTSTFGSLAGLAFDSSSNKLYVAERGGATINVGIRVLDLTGNTVSLVAGALNQYRTVEGIGATARFENPRGLSWADNGDLLVADAGNRIRRIVLSSNTVSTFAGMGVDDLIATNPFSVRLNNPQSVVVDSKNNVYFADRGNSVIRKYDAATKQVSIVAGKKGVTGSSNGPALDSALFYQPYSLALKNDSLFISDGEGISPNGIRILNLTTKRVSLFAAVRGQLLIYKNSLLVFGDADGGGSVQNRILRFNIPTRVRDTLAGTGGNGISQGPGRQAQIANPQWGAIWNDTLYFLTGRSVKPWRIRTMDLNSPLFNVDTLFSKAQINVLDNPSNLVIDKFGTLYIANNASGNLGIFRANMTNKTILPRIANGGILPANLTGLAFDTNKNALIIGDGSLNRILRLSPLYSIVNLAPGFALARTRDTLFRTDGSLKTLTGTATSMTANVSIFNTVQNQTVSFKTSVPANQVNLFSQVPTVSPEGVLSYQLSNNVPFANTGNLAVLVTIRAKDNGGTADGGVDSSATQTFTILIRYQNLAPVFTIAQDTITIFNTATAAQTVTNYLTAVASGAAQEPGQTLTFVVSNNNGALFTTQPALTGSNANRNLGYRINGTLGMASIKVLLKDNGGLANGGLDSAVKIFVINVVINTGISDLLKRKISFGPNPASQSLRFSNLAVDADVELYDLQGRSQGSFSLDNEQNVIVAGLSRGIYFIKVKEKGLPVFSAKFIKE